MTKNVAIALLAITLIGTVAMPAVGGPSLIGLDKREQRHYQTLSRQVRVLTALHNAGLSQKINTASLEQRGRFYVGSAYCTPDDGVLTGGGVDWGLDDGVYGNWVVNYSHPDTTGKEWRVSLFNGSDAGPVVTPRVYAICTDL